MEALALFRRDMTRFDVRGTGIFEVVGNARGRVVALIERGKV
jgi:hypothetical protein